MHNSRSGIPFAAPLVQRSPPAMPTHAITRSISPAYASALAAAPPPVPIDLAAAHVQHAAYQAALASLGLSIVSMPPDPDHPDSCFVEDTAIVADGAVLLTRSGAPSRRGEVEAVAAVLANFADLGDLHRTEAPATLDGGDCMRLGRTIYVGLSARTNQAGADRVREVFAPLGFEVVAIPLPPAILHLKCVCSPLADDQMLLADGSLPAALFGGAGIVRVPDGERYAANALAHGGGVIVSAGHPQTAAALEAAGYRVLPLQTTEFRKADGSLTCLSILV
jgi:dimethylargininase